MDPRFPVSREEFYSVQMDVKQMQMVQTHHAERLSRLEKRQADDAAIKSAWNSPFPSALSGTPQHGPLHLPPNDIFDDFEEQGQNLLGSLHLDAEDEPTRRGAASRANSVRFDESALQGSSWANGRHSADFGPIRPGSGLGTHGMMERSLSHKSDGRHSSAGHSVHSIHSHHSVASGRGSSLGLDTNFNSIGHEDDSPISFPEPPPGLLFLGSVPSIIRCWLTENFAHETILYADVCTGSQKSVIDISLVKELGLLDEIHRDLEGTSRLRLPVFLVDAILNSSSSRSASPAPQMTPHMPNLLANFEVVGIDQPDNLEVKKCIRIFLGSETLREHSADVLLSRNKLVVYGYYGGERERLSVPFATPEDNASYKNLRTTTVAMERPKLNATARPFVFTESRRPTPSFDAETNPDSRDPRDDGSPTSEQMPKPRESLDDGPVSDAGIEMERTPKNVTLADTDLKDDDAIDTQSDNSRRETAPAGGIWSSWRTGTSGNGTDSKENAPLSGYQPAGRTRMKVLKPGKASSSSSARTGASYEPPPPPRSEPRRKSQAGSDGTPSGTVRWDSKRPSISSAEPKAPTAAAPSGAREPARNVSQPAPRSAANPVGGASAFSWMTPPGKPKAATAE